jgi:hypothetical protein
MIEPTEDEVLVKAQQLARTMAGCGSRTKKKTTASLMRGTALSTIPSGLKT